MCAEHRKWRLPSAVECVAGLASAAQPHTHSALSLHPHGLFSHAFACFAALCSLCRWSWAICTDTCAICRNNLYEPSIEYQANPTGG
jgi:hypothetical protein